MYVVYPWNLSTVVPHPRCHYSEICEKTGNSVCKLTLYLEHVCSQHNTNVNVEGVIRAIEGCNPNILTIAKSLSSF